MREPFYNDASSMEVFDCLAEFDGPNMPQMETIKRYIHKQKFTLVKPEVVLWLWHGRQLHREHPAAYQVILHMPYDSLPSDEMFRKALGRIKAMILATPETYDDQQIFRPLTIGTSSLNIRSEERVVAVNRKVALQQLNDLTYPEVQDLWQQLRAQRLPPFPPPQPGIPEDRAVF